MNYKENAESDARDTAMEYFDDIKDALFDSGKASDDLLNDYSNGDSYHHENHVDQWYNPTEAVECLDELDEWEETDRGLWEGVESWRDMLSAIAAYTYGNAVYAMWQKLIADLNDWAGDWLNDQREQIKLNLAEEQLQLERANVDERNKGKAPDDQEDYPEADDMTVDDDDVEERLKKDFEEELKNQINAWTY